MSQRILVTGGSGYLGSHVRAYFGADDFSRRNGNALTDAGTFPEIESYDAIIHLAGCTSKGAEAQDQCFSVNSAGTANLAKRLRPGQVFIFASTKDVYGTHSDKLEFVNEQCPTTYAGQSAYEWSKLIAEKHVEYQARQRGARAGIFRLSTTYAPPSEGNSGTFLNYFATAVREGRKLTLKANGRQVRDPLHVNDLCSAFEKFISWKDQTAATEIFNIGGGRTNWTTLLELTQTLGELLNRQPAVELNSEPEPGQMRYVTDTRKLERTLDWHPARSLAEGLRTII